MKFKILNSKNGPTLQRCEKSEYLIRVGMRPVFCHQVSGILLTNNVVMVTNMAA